MPAFLKKDTNVRIPRRGEIESGDTKRVRDKEDKDPNPKKPKRPSHPPEATKMETEGPPVASSSKMVSTCPRFTRTLADCSLGCCQKCIAFLTNSY